MRALILLVCLPLLCCSRKFNPRPRRSEVDGKPCETIRNEACQIPFFYKGYMHYECSIEPPGDEGGALFGRCPTKLVNQATREPSMKTEDWSRCGRHCPLQQYTSNSDINANIIKVVRENPGLAQLVTVGTSHLGTSILGVTLSRNVTYRDTLKPMVRYVGNMHGNEPVGRELLHHFIQVLIQGYSVDNRIKNLLDETSVTLIPTMNPDGFDRGTEGKCSGGDYKTGRYNEGNIDLNRNFPTWREVGKSYQELREGREPETQAMMDLIVTEPWVLSANFHGGAVVASYPYDDFRRPDQTGISRTRDHDFFKHLASVYASNHLSMLDQTQCTKWYFEDGITNGAEWYSLVGGMQDFNYLFTNDMEITLEVSCCKFPNKYYLNKMWAENRESLLVYLEQVHRGLKGVVVNSISGEPLAGVEVEVENLNTRESLQPVRSSTRGEYWKLLLPGSYRIRGSQNSCATGGRHLVSDWVQIDVGNDVQRSDIELGSQIPCSTQEDVA